MNAVLGSTAFVFPELLPRLCAIRPEENRHHTRFTRAADQLIAMGMEMFSRYLDLCVGDFRSGCKVCPLISKYTLPYTKRILVNRCNNVRYKNNPDNPIVFYLNTGRPPPLPIIDVLPEWPLRRPRDRSHQLPEPWRSLAARGNAFFSNDWKGLRGRLVCHRMVLKAAGRPPPAKAERCPVCQKPRPVVLTTDSETAAGPEGSTIDLKQEVTDSAQRAGNRTNPATEAGRRSAQDGPALCEMTSSVVKLERPSPSWMKAAVGRSAPVSARRTGVVAPTVRRQSTPHPDPLPERDGGTQAPAQNFFKRLKVGQRATYLPVLKRWDATY